MYLLQLTCILFLVTNVKMQEDDMTKISEALKKLDAENPNRSFGSPADLMKFLIDAVDVTFMTKCSAYESYIKGNLSNHII